MKPFRSILLALSLSLALSSPVLADSILAEYSSTPWGHTASQYLTWGQTFTPVDNGLLDSITIYGRAVDQVDFSLPANLTFTLYDVVGANTLSAIASVTIATPVLSTTSYLPITASFASSSLSLAQGQQYAFAVSYEMVSDKLVLFEISDPGYTGGELITLAGLTYTPHITETNLTFKVTGTESVPDATSTVAALVAALLAMAGARWHFGSRIPCRVQR